MEKGEDGDDRLHFACQTMRRNQGRYVGSPQSECELKLETQGMYNRENQIRRWKVGGEGEEICNWRTRINRSVHSSTTQFQISRLENSGNSIPSHPLFTFRRGLLGCRRGLAILTAPLCGSCFSKELDMRLAMARFESSCSGPKPLVY